MSEEIAEGQREGPTERLSIHGEPMRSVKPQPGKDHTNLDERSTNFTFS